MAEIFQLNKSPKDVNYKQYNWSYNLLFRIKILVYFHITIETAIPIFSILNLGDKL